MRNRISLYFFTNRVVSFSFRQFCRFANFCTNLANYCLKLGFLCISPRIGTFDVYLDHFCSIWSFAKISPKIIAKSHFLKFLHTLRSMRAFCENTWDSQNFGCKRCKSGFLCISSRIRWLAAVSDGFANLRIFALSLPIIISNSDFFVYLHELAHLAFI